MSTKTIKSEMPLRQRFDLQHRKGADGDCWMWAGQISRRGYGFIKENYKTKLAHRVSYELFVGPIPAGLFVCHRCDNPACVNPGHLFVGTAKDNRKDMFDKGRGNCPRGENHPFSKITKDDVLEIRTSKKRGCDLAVEYGLSRSTITQIRNGDRWAWLA